MNGTEFWAGLDRAGFQALRVLLSVLWQSSILLGAVALISLALRRKRAAARHVVWLGALLAVPVLPVLAWALSHVGTPQARVAVMPAYIAPAVEFSAPLTQGIPRPPAAPPGLPVERVPPPLSLSDYPWALTFLGYLTGAVAFLSLVLVGRLRIAGWVRRAQAVRDPRVGEAFEWARGQARTRGEFRLLESEHLETPITVGTLRPAVLIPTGFSQIVSGQELRAVAVHELAHLRRRDPLVLGLASLLRAVLFFHPLVWLACRQVSNLAEAACDEVVLDVTGEPVTYAKMLTRLAERLSASSLSTELAAGIVLSKSAFLRRVEAILSDRRDEIRKLSRIALAGTLTGVALSLGLALALPVGEKERKPVVETVPRQAEASEWAATLPNGVTVELVGVSFHPSKGKQWWRPDGTSLERAPYDVIGPGVAGEGITRETAVRLVADDPAHIGLTWDFRPSRGSSPDDGPKRDGKEVKSLRAASAVFVPAQEAAALRVGIAAGPWKKLVRADARGGNITTGEGYAVLMQPPQARGGGTDLTFSFELENHASRMLAVDTAGASHEPSSVNLDATNSHHLETAHFDKLRPDRITEFLFQARPYEWVEFRNVSLQPGHKTNVEVIVEGIPGEHGKMVQGATPAPLPEVDGAARPVSVPFPNVDESVINLEIARLVRERIEKQRDTKGDELHKEIVAMGTNAVPTLIAVAQKAANTDPLVLRRPGCMDYGFELRWPVRMLVDIGDRRAIPLISALVRFDDPKGQRMIQNLAELLCHGTDAQIEADAKSADPNLARAARMVIKDPQTFAFAKSRYRKKEQTGQGAGESRAEGETKAPDPQELLREYQAQIKAAVEAYARDHDGELPKTTDDILAYIPDKELAAKLRPALEWARAEARKSVLRQRLHGLSLAIMMYRKDHNGEYPPDLKVLEAWPRRGAGSALGEDNPLESFDVGDQKVQYVIPKSDDPNEALLYHWPPYTGGTWVLCQNLELDWVEPAKDGSLTNPRTGAVIRPADSAEQDPMQRPATFGPVTEWAIERVAKDDAGSGVFVDLDTAKLFRGRPDLKDDAPEALNQWAKGRSFDAMIVFDAQGLKMRFFDAWTGYQEGQAARETWDTITAKSLRQREYDAMWGIVRIGMLPDKKAEEQRLWKARNQTVAVGDFAQLPVTVRFMTREGGVGILQIVGFTEDPPGAKIRYKMVQDGPGSTADKEEPARGKAVEGLRCGLEVLRRELPFGEEPRFRVTLTNEGTAPMDLVGPPYRSFGQGSDTSTSGLYVGVQVRIEKVGASDFVASYGAFGAKRTAVRLAAGKALVLELPPPGRDLTRVEASFKALMPGSYRAVATYFFRDADLERLLPGFVFGEDQGELAGRKPDRLWQGRVYSAAVPFEVLDDGSDQLKLLRGVYAGQGIKENLRLELSAARKTVGPGGLAHLRLTARNAGGEPLYLGGNYGLHEGGPRGQRSSYRGARPEGPQSLEAGKSLSLVLWEFGSGEPVGPGTYDLWAEYKAPLPPCQAGPAETLAKSNVVTVEVIRRGSGFGPVIERFVNDDDGGRDCFIDFETGRLFTPPANIAEIVHSQRTWLMRIGGGLRYMELLSWIRENGIDAVADTDGYSTGKGLFCFDFTVFRWLTAKESLEDVTVDAVENEMRSGDARRFGGMRQLRPMHGYINQQYTSADTCIFRTHEGGAGVLQVVGFTENPKGVKIRYKMVQGNEQVPAAG